MTDDAAAALRHDGAIRIARMAEQMAGVGHWHYDIAADKVMWSDQVYRIYGLDPATTGEPDLAFVLASYHPEDRPQLEKLIERAMTTGEPYDFELRLMRRGEERIVVAKADTERGPDGTITAMYGIFMDVTAVKRVEADLRAAKDAAEAAAAKSDFLSNVSHELRTPLTALVGFSSLLAESPDLSVRGRHYSDRIGEASRALHHIVNDLLDISRIEQGAMLFDFAPFMVDDVVAEVFATIAEDAVAKRLALIADIAPAPLGFRGDAMRIRQILLNLVDNAVKFTRHGGVTVQARLSNAVLVLEVADTGPGIPAAYLARLFDRFSQADASMTRTHGGLGLGLAICKGLTEAMGGTITVDSTAERGTRFRVELPQVEIEEMAGPTGIEPVFAT